MSLSRQDVVNRLELQCPSLATVLVGLSGLKPLRFPAAVVLPAAEVASPPALLGTREQQVLERFDVDLVHNFTGSEAAAQLAAGQIDAARSEILNALNGWLPAGAAVPVRHATGQLVEYTAGLGLLWRDTFEFESYRS